MDTVVEMDINNSRRFEQMISNQNKAEEIRNKKLAAVRYRKKVLHLALLVAIMVAVGMLFALFLYSQTVLSDLSRDNSDAKDRISLLKQDIINAEEANNGVTDLDSIRAQAIALGMQDPDSSQVVSLPFRGSDKLVVALATNNGGVDSDALEEATSNLAQYYRGSFK